jgi:uncharacterized protein YkwD
MAGRSATILLLLALLAVPAAQAAEAVVDEAIAALNAVRTARGLAPVTERPQLSAAARTHLADMAERGYFSVDPPGEGVFRDWYARAGFVPAASDIIVSAGYPEGGLLIEALLDAGTFGEVLLDRHAGEIGIGHRSSAFRTGADFVTDAWVLVVARTAFDPVEDAAIGLAEAINRARRARGLPPVTLEAGLSAAAMAHASDMAGSGYFAHRSPDGRDVGDRARRFGYRYRAIGENLAAGQMTPDSVVQGWTDSPGHAGIMFDPAFRDLGIGYLPGPVVEPGRALGQIWVAVFGTRR